MRMEPEQTFLCLRDRLLIDGLNFLHDAFCLNDVIYEIDICLRSWRFRLYEGDSKVKYNYRVVKSENGISHMDGSEVKDGIG